ncbi:MAG: insulinase family protein [Melioribacteraceae bacterium]|nr:insulinase family protein [Melioribacteraceae bacterium]MCF8263525.1 insulinase family protein [Melioribacteraceae bacterium]MCF8411891.1 insulinase family protein [Melioribacteraceae bacterium]MCF8431536.1 insulinase family protein [Melioribacteraceae bacterium]
MNHYNITELSSGIKIVSEKIPYVKSFSLGFWFDVGSRDETTGNNGISHFLEHMFFKGTKTRSAKRISDEIESLGGYLNAFTSKEQTCFYGRGLSQHLERTFRVLADMLQNSLFRESDIKKESLVVIDELLDIEDNPEELIFDSFETRIFEGNPISLPIIGTEKNISAFNSQKLFDFIKKNYGFNNFYIVASGAVEHENLVKYCEKYIVKDLGITGKVRSPFHAKKSTDQSLYKEVQQSHLIIGKPTFGLKDDERIPVNILSTILGEGSSSRLFQRLREKNGIAYQISSFLNSFHDTSAFGVYLSTNDNAFLKGYGLILEEFKKLRDKPVSEKELKRAKEYFKGNILLSLENTTNRMLRIAQSVICFGEIKDLSLSIEQIDSVTREEILKVSNELLNESELVKVIISSKNHLHLNAA